MPFPRKLSHSLNHYQMRQTVLFDLKIVQTLDTSHAEEELQKRVKGGNTQTRQITKSDDRQGPIVFPPGTADKREFGWRQKYYFLDHHSPIGMSVRANVLQYSTKRYQNSWLHL